MNWKDKGIILISLLALICILVGTYYFWMESEILVCGEMYLERCPEGYDNPNHEHVVWAIDDDNGNHFFLARDDWTLMNITDYDHTFLFKKVMIRGVIRQYQGEENVINIIKVIEFGEC